MIQIVLSIVVSRHWPIHQVDVKNAFQNGYLIEEVYMKQPHGYVDLARPTHVCRLRKALYGLKQAPRAWYHRFAVFIASIGFISSKSDNSIFTYHRGCDTIYLLLYVDDIILTISSAGLVHRVISWLSIEFAMMDLGELSYFLDIAANTKSKLSSLGTPISDPTLYRSLADALQYLTFSRLDIAYAVQQVCLFVHDPREPHMDALKRILQFLQGTLSEGLFIHPSSIHRLVSYTDADWAGCPDTRRSTFRFCVFLGDNLVSWSSKRQHVVSCSSAKAEYRGVANVVAEAAWLHNLGMETGRVLVRVLVYPHPFMISTFVSAPLPTSAVYLASNPVQHQRTKHVEIDLHFVREHVAFGHVRVLHVPSQLQFAVYLLKDCPRSYSLSFGPV
nr:putative polyprotein [Tanacetum cinerariifolium]